MIDLHRIIVNTIEAELETTLWQETDLFYKIKYRSIDQRGRIGEHLFNMFFKEREIEYVDNSHGDWDIVIDGLKIEIKTATLDVNQKFQHEGIKENKLWDVVAFLDIAPNNIYITFIHKDDFTFALTRITNSKQVQYGTVSLGNKILNIHCRGKDNTLERATGAGYKVDFKLHDLNEVSSIEEIILVFEEMKNRHGLNTPTKTFKR